MRTSLIACALGILLQIPGAEAADPLPPWERPRGIVTFTVDAITMQFFENSFPIFQEYGVEGTLYGQTAPLGAAPWDMNWEHIRQISGAGWEIGAHSYTHERHLDQVDKETLDLELGAPAARIYREISLYPSTFATPFGAFSDEMLEVVRLYYDAHLMAWGNEGMNPLSGVDHFRINRIEMAELKTAKAICSHMERASAERQWLVFMIHSIVEHVEEGEPSKYQISFDTLRDVLACAKALEEENRIAIMTAAEALKHVPHVQ